MDRRVFLGLSAGRLLGLRGGRQISDEEPQLDGRPPYDWIADIKRGTSYRLLKSIARVDLVHLSPPEQRGGNLRLHFIDWNTYPDQDHFLAIPVVRPNPEWHVLGPVQYSVSLWLGPRARNEAPSALIEFESPASGFIYAHEERVQQIILLAGRDDPLQTSY